MPVRNPDDNPLLPKRILFGGAFDPPHQGHVDALKLALARFPSARAIVAPAATPAGASGHHKTTTLPFATRLELARLAFGDVERVEVSGIEGELPTPNYTLNTLRALKALYPGERLGLLIGQDQFLSFPKWYAPRQILELASLIVVRRDRPDGYAGGLLQTIKTFAETMHEPYQWAEEGKEARFPGLTTAVYLIDSNLCVAQSTLIRQFLAAGRPLPDGWMPRPVLERIHADHLYRHQEMRP